MTIEKRKPFDANSTTIVKYNDYKNFTNPLIDTMNLLVDTINSIESTLGNASSGLIKEVRELTESFIGSMPDNPNTVPSSTDHNDTINTI